MRTVTIHEKEGGSDHNGYRGRSHGSCWPQHHLDYIEPGNAGNSYLYRKLTGSGIAETRMPRGASPLSSATIDSIRAWIDRGALNN